MTDSLSLFSPDASRPFIGGKWVPGEGDRVVVENPADESVVGTVEGASLAQFDLAVAAARASFDSAAWSALPKQERIRILGRFVHYLDANSGMLLEASILEVGTPRATAKGIHVAKPINEIREGLELFGMMSDEHQNALPPRLLFGSERGGRVSVSLSAYEPLGVIAAITAFNAPMYLNVWKVVPALAAGCSVVLRPNALTPYAALALAQAAEAVGMPEGVLNVVVEQGAEGAQALVAHPLVDGVSFTGSVPVGRQIMRAASGTLKRTVLELGGKSVQIYLPDSLDGVAAGVLPVLCGMAGQVCSAPTRMLVPEDRRAEVEERLAGAVAAIRVGDPQDPDVMLGPVITAAQRARCEHYVQAGIDAGASLVAGGHRAAGLDKGYYFEPTVLSMRDHRNPAAVEEIFGPVLCLLGYDDEEHAVRIANDSELGLGGVVYSRDPWRGYRLARQIRTGTVTVNSPLVSGWVSSGGVKQSGIGRERGAEGFRSFQHLKTINVASYLQS